MKLKFSISHHYTFFFSISQDVDAIFELLHEAKVNNMLTNTCNQSQQKHFSSWWVKLKRNAKDLWDFRYTPGKSVRPLNSRALEKLYTRSIV